MSNDCNSNGVPDECEMITPGDFDGNGIIDLGDLEGFVECIGGPGALPAQTEPACIALCLDAFDLDGDGDVDLVDFANWTLLFTP
jgi:hypothetical protein